jgi:NAD(P)-dependent dehydrogenase (short-subunit alcohol dehydrogenase family)
MCLYTYLAGAVLTQEQVGATKNVAWRFHQDGIRCNGVLPGGVATNIASSVQMDQFDPAGFNAFL